MATLAARLLLGLVFRWGETMPMVRRLVVVTFLRFTVATLAGRFRMVFHWLSVRPCSLLLLLLHGHKFFQTILALTLQWQNRTGKMGAQGRQAKNGQSPSLPLRENPNS